MLIQSCGHPIVFHLTAPALLESFQDALPHHALTMLSQYPFKSFHYRSTC